jgi:hypothetical protein
MGVFDDIKIALKIGGDLVPIYQEIVNILKTEDGKKLKQNIAILISNINTDEGGNVTVENKTGGKYVYDSLQGWVWVKEDKNDNI